MSQKTLEHFITKAKNKHGNRYDYTKVKYISSNTKVLIICKDHGEFWQTPTAHYIGNCPKCTGRVPVRPDGSNIPVPIGAKAVPLTKGKYALVDEEDYERVMEYNWYCTKTADLLYAKSYIGGYKNTTYLHRHILGVHDGKIKVDHKNGNGLDCRKENLRTATHVQNLWNVNKKRGTSQYKGVYWNKGAKKWQASATGYGRTGYIGVFENEIDAAKAYDSVIKKLRGEFGVLNFE